MVEMSTVWTVARLRMNIKTTSEVIDAFSFPASIDNFTLVYKVIRIFSQLVNTTPPFIADAVSFPAP